MPGQKLVEIEKKYKQKELMSKKDAYSIYRFYVEHLRYRFAVLVQFNEGKVTDFHARLPQYFLHDVFHQSLINRIGMQDVYKKVEEQAVYIWNNKNNNKYYYSGACTITCFPIYYGVIGLNYLNKSGFKSILDQLEQASKPPSSKPQ